MINLLLHGSVLAQKKSFNVVSVRDPVQGSRASRSVWLLAIDCLFEHLNSLLKGFIFLNQSFNGLIDFIWSIRVIHLGPKLNKTHFYTRIQYFTKVTLSMTQTVWLIKNDKITYFLYINDFESYVAFDRDYIIMILIFGGHNLKDVLLVNFHKNHQNGKIESVHIFQLLDVHINFALIII